VSVVDWLRAIHGPCPHFVRVASLAGFAGWSAAHGEIPLQLDGGAYLLRWLPHGITYYSILGAISIVHFSHRYFGVLSRSM
jgi:hypothetical protein